MRVNTNEINPALISLVRDFNQIIQVDANFFLAPDRTKQIKGTIPFDFSLFRNRLGYVFRRNGQIVSD